MSTENNLFDAEENTSQNKNNKNAVVLLGLAIVICAIILTVVLISTVASAGKNTTETTRYEVTTNNKIESTTDEAYFESVLGIENQTTQGEISTQVDSSESNEIENIYSQFNNENESTTKNTFAESYAQLPVTGENLLSDHFDNEFIKLVSNEYEIDSDLLVAIYSVPDTGVNFVLQFNGDKDLRGNYIKSPDTLEKVYQIDLDKNIKVATGKNSGNIGVSYPESVMVVGMVKTVVMEQYPNYFTDLKGK